MLEPVGATLTALFAVTVIVFLRFIISNSFIISDSSEDERQSFQHVIMATLTRADQDLNIIKFSQDNYTEQHQSPLFRIPGEIRDRIFAYALAEFEDSSVAFDEDTCYRRPDYAAPRRSDTALLRTCQRVYAEAFFYPFALAEQILWLTAASRRPANVTTVERLKPSLALMQRLHGETELASVRVFAQLYLLESGRALSNILDMPYFLPRSMTVTIRHTDIWNWESDNPIHISGMWSQVCRFPSSLRCLNVQVESLERRRDQIDYIVEQMIEKWRFTRRDNTVLQASTSSVSISRWSGSSTWADQRWVRDESRPGAVDYYVATVAFRPVAAQDVRPHVAQGNLRLGPMPGARAMGVVSPYISTHELRRASVPDGASAEEAMARWNEWRRAAREREREASINS